MNQLWMNGSAREGMESRRERASEGFREREEYCEICEAREWEGVRLHEWAGRNNYEPCQGCAGWPGGDKRSAQHHHFSGEALMLWCGCLQCKDMCRHVYHTVGWGGGHPQQIWLWEKSVADKTAFPQQLSSSSWKSWRMRGNLHQIFGRSACETPADSGGGHLFQYHTKATVWDTDNDIFVIVRHTLKGSDKVVCKCSSLHHRDKASHTA